MNEQGFGVSFGEKEIREKEITEGVIYARTHETPDNVVYVVILISNGALLNAAPDYQSEARLFSLAADREILFTGLVDVVAPGQNQTKIVLVSDMQLLKEAGTGGLGVGAGSYALETSWSLLRVAGVDAERIKFPEFDPPWEPFEVAAPLDGVELKDAINIGSVQLLPTGTVSHLADDLGPDSLRRLYAKASVWALSHQTARTLFEAEAKGLKDIDFALAWLTAGAHYSSVALPGRPLREFRRAWSTSRVSRRDATLVRGLITGRRWLRSPENIAYRPTLDECCVD